MQLQPHELKKFALSWYNHSLCILGVGVNCGLFSIMLSFRNLEEQIQNRNFPSFEIEMFPI